jgi:hypothetical protein
MNKKFTLFFSLLLIFFGCQAGNNSKSLIINKIESELVEYLYSKYDDFQVTEIFSSKDDKHQYISSGLGNKIIDNSKYISSKELYFKNITNKYESHIGIISIEYQEEKSAKNAYLDIEKKGYFSNTKILTKYLLLNIGKENLIIYSESVADKIVNKFFERLSAMNSNDIRIVD